MTTFVGTQTNYIDAIKELIELDYDAIEAYEQAINNLENEAFKSKMEEFKSDHARHVNELTSALTAEGYADVPRGPSAKQWLTKGKVVLAEIAGDEYILKAMLDNEKDTNTAYTRMCERTDMPAQIMQIVAQGLKDEQKHKNWIQVTCKPFNLI